MCCSESFVAKSACNRAEADLALALFWELRTFMNDEFLRFQRGEIPQAPAKVEVQHTECCKSILFIPLSMLVDTICAYRSLLCCAR